MNKRATIAGFTLVEALLATALMGAILAAIATVTAQWLPNWNRGFTRVQATETLTVGLERIVADLASAEFITAGATARPRRCSTAPSCPSPSCVPRSDRTRGPASNSCASWRWAARKA